MPKFTFGTDPEFMLVDKKGNHISAIDVVPGNRNERHLHNGHEFFYDNVLAECAIKPGKTKEEAIENIREALTHYAELVQPYKLKAQAAWNYKPEQLTHEHAIEAGCSAEHCAYQIAVMEPLAAEEFLMGGTLRTGGGHIHLGTTCFASITLGSSWLTKVLDMFVGVPSIFIDKDPTSKERKVLYGQPGRYRPKDYGLEYRTVGNFWLTSPKLVEIIYELCDCAIQFIEDENHLEWWSFDEDKINEKFWKTNGDVSSLQKCHAYDPEKLRQALTEMDEEAGQEYMEMILPYLPKSLRTKIDKASNRKEPDLYKEWKIKCAG